MKVSEWLEKHPQHPITVRPESRIREVADYYLSHPAERDLYIVTSEGRILGHIRHRRLALALLKEHLPVQSSHQIMERLSCNTAKDLMEHEFVTAHPEEELDNVIHRMMEYLVEDMPVIDDEELIIGKINLTEILLAIQQDEI